MHIFREKMEEICDGTELCSHILIMIEHLIHSFGKSIMDHIRGMEASIIIGGAQFMEFFPKLPIEELFNCCVPSFAETCVIGVGCLLRACIKIWDLYKNPLITRQMFIQSTIEILTKYSFIGFTAWFADFASKFFLSSVLSGISTGAACVLSAICGGFAVGFIGYELGEFIGKILQKHWPNPEKKERKNWVKYTKWTFGILGLVGGIVLCCYFPPAAIVLVGAACSIGIAKIVEYVLF